MLMMSTLFFEFEIFFGVGKEGEEAEDKLPLGGSNASGGDDENPRFVVPLGIFQRGKYFFFFCHC